MARKICLDTAVVSRHNPFACPDGGRQFPRVSLRLLPINARVRPPSRLPELRVARRGGGAADLRGAAGGEVWFDQDALVGGDAWDQKIRGQIGRCALFMPVISAATQERLEGYFPTRRPQPKESNRWSQRSLKPGRRSQRIPPEKNARSSALWPLFSLRDLGGKKSSQPGSKWINSRPPQPAAASKGGAVAQPPKYGRPTVLRRLGNRRSRWNDQNRRRNARCGRIAAHRGNRNPPPRSSRAPRFQIQARRGG